MCATMRERARLPSRRFAEFETSDLNSRSYQEPRQHRETPLHCFLFMARGTALGAGMNIFSNIFHNAVSRRTQSAFGGTVRAKVAGGFASCVCPTLWTIWNKRSTLFRRRQF